MPSWCWQLAAAPTAQQAAQKFFSQQGVESGETSRRQIGGFPAAMSTFRVQTEGGYLRGQVAWIDYRDRVFQILGYTPEARWNQYSNVLGAAITSFGRETDSAVLNVQPSRLKIVDLNRRSTLETLLRDYPSTVSPQTVALINNLQGAETLSAGDQFKRVLGGAGTVGLARQCPQSLPGGSPPRVGSIPSSGTITHTHPDTYSR